MFKYAVFVILLFFVSTSRAQTLAQQLANKIGVVQSSQQLAHGIISLCVADEATGNIIYSINEQLGLMPASNMKVFTAIAALDLLGEDYRFKTEVGYSGNIVDSILYGNLFIVGFGDPTTGSWRYSNSKEDSLMKRIAYLLHGAGIYKIQGNVILDGSKFNINPIPDGWSWGDMGSYYGAGTWGLNWHENQYDIDFKPSPKIGDSVAVKKITPELTNIDVVNEVTTGASGSGDNSYPYLPPYGNVALLEGTFARDEKGPVSGSLPEPYTPIAEALKKMFVSDGFQFNGLIQNSFDYTLAKQALPHYETEIGSLLSPPMDSIIYWFMKKSINLYGEDLIKTMALEKYGIGSTDSGVAILRNFWQARGIEKSAFHATDGSGLSATNHVTTHGLVQALLYAKSRSWFASFFDALPVYNNMHMKSGTISSVKAFSGYHTSAKGKQYAFSIIVNNYDGSTEAIINKMYGILDELKK